MGTKRREEEIGGGVEGVGKRSKEKKEKGNKDDEYMKELLDKQIVLLLHTV